MKARRTLATILLSGALLGVWPGSALAPPRGRPVIESARLYTDGESLLCDVTSSGLLGERIAGTVRSGLPAVVELFFELAAARRGGRISGVRSWSMRYDVWEDVYSVSDGDTTVVLPSLEALEDMVSRLKGIPLVPLSRLAPEASFSVRFSIAVNPLLGSEGGRPDGWVEETLAGERGDGWREQVLSVNDLIAHFFARGRGAQSRSDWFETGRTTPRQLPRASGRKE